MGSYRHTVLLETMSQKCIGGQGPKEVVTVASLEGGEQMLVLAGE